jgi:hypothetical protein
VRLSFLEVSCRQFTAGKIAGVTLDLVQNSR